MFYSVTLKLQAKNFTIFVYRILPSSGILRGVRWFATDVSGLIIGPIFKGQAVQEEETDSWKEEQ
jgi:hypothetical protein